MNKQKRAILGVIVIATLIIGIAYAAVSTITLTITGNVTTNAASDNFKVYFTAVTQRSDETNVTASVTSGSTSATLNFLLLIALIIYARKTETEEDRYKNEVRKIVNTYDSYISKIEDEFNMDGYQILKVASFV